MTSIFQETCIQNDAQRILQRKYITPRKRIADRQPCSSFLSQSTSKEDGHDNLSSWLDSRNLSWLSPVSTVSTASSLASADFLWDSPKTPSGPSDEASSRSILTPLTPPTTFGSSKKLLFTPIPQPSFGSSIASAAKQPLLEKKDVTLPDDPFFQPKLFRGFTFELEAISEKSVAGARVKYDFDPSFNFDDNAAVSSRTRSKTAKKTPVTSAIHAAFNGGKTHIEDSRHPDPTPSQVELRTLLEHIVPLDLHARLAQDSGRCSGSLVKDSSDRCKSRLKHGNVLEEVRIIIQKLARAKSQERYRDMLDLIKQLVISVMCVVHRNTALGQPENKRKPNAKSKLMELDRMFTNLGEIGKDQNHILMQWLDTISDSHASIGHISWLYATVIVPKPIRQPESATEPKPVTKPKLGVPTPATAIQASSSSSFIPYQSERSKKTSVFDAVYQKATAPLGVIAQKRGFVYLFWDKEYFGMVKIGYTKDLTQRLESWNQQCGREHIYHSSTECQVEIPHAHRVEQLVHAELKEYRKRRQCEGCGTMHKEWFDAGQAHVVKVLRKWREWILQEPYVQDKESGEWVLKPEMLDALESTCEPLPREVSTQKSGKKSVARRPTTQKKKSFRRTM
ncbi:hypothetical protein J4E82_009542 [Alternaria postmessia]|uniref:uncharacterized protein n=1 Tax=Alternaria postmessia TaxID=1187938 RepID=UPI002224858E|nr:uncharacterized protein J4E82_009542 [Alternaria postmessia]KAI5371802.1 hypothetical protein J4E82_009542 [Alternaria postmessia]